MQEHLKNSVIDKVKARFGTAVKDVVWYAGELTVTVDKDAIVGVSSYLKNEPDIKMSYLSDISVVDNMPRVPRFDISYHLLSIDKKSRMRVKIAVGDGEKAATVTSVWRSANWYERENYDMFGIVFEGHPDPRRIYLAEDWEGYPLRKDYPLKGYKDQYNPFGEEKKK
ncbi:MAG: NADH-quinone oxidoreductase subunit C [Deltaproteobacteria bacterium]|nr:NADH-quinone oxidoreductase subunit C [Deltaproteobacteria bacterium]